MLVSEGHVYLLGEQPQDGRFLAGQGFLGVPWDSTCDASQR